MPLRQPLALLFDMGGVIFDVDFDRAFKIWQPRKPEREAFDHISQALGIAAASIVFFDDLLENVQGATAAGFQAVHVRSPRDVRNALSSFGYAL